MENTVNVEALLKELDAQREAYLNTFQKVHELLAQNLVSTATNTAVPSRSSEPSRTHSASERDEVDIRKTSPGTPTLQTSSASKYTGEESDEESDESFYAQDLLPEERYEHDDLREHLRTHEFNSNGKKILTSIIDNPARLEQPWLFPTQPGPVDDRSHYTGFHVFDVAADGAPLMVDVSEVETVTSKATAVWHAIKDVNLPSKHRLAVGRLTIVREPSPILFGAIHFTMHDNFDMDEIFHHLVEANTTSAHIHRAFDGDPRRQSSFVFSFEYFTIIGEECKPMKWQLADRQEKRAKHHIAITRCSAVIALALNGKPVRKVRNPARRAKNTHGYAFDPWAPYHVLQLQCFPDWKSTTDVHDSTKHYLNGAEAFMATLLGEYRDAQRRFEDIYNAITKLITPPLEFMFDSDLRDKLLFEDRAFTYSRRYFWAFQTLGIINDSIKSMVDAYEDTFTAEVWEGKHKTLWPLLDEHSPRNEFYKRRMAGLKARFDREIANLRILITENNERRAEIRSLRDQLFSGTSVLESRKSVDQQEITVQQGHNIKLLTLVSIFFLPLTFVTTVFGMTNMPTEGHFWMFAIVLCTVCIPFFVLIGSMNTIRGMKFWRAKTKAVLRNIGYFLAWLTGIRKKLERHDTDAKDDDAKSIEIIRRTTSTNEGMLARLRRFSGPVKVESETEVEPVEKQMNGDQVFMRPDEQNGNVRPAYIHREPSHIVGMLKGEAQRHDAKKNMHYSHEV
ncbi:MAG: hypothetical protein M1820_002927 [Bogoriella megaspora]|nr:MAG: hypothetical protein M1820_002927 [Bogoriella megaspora]